MARHRLTTIIGRQLLPAFGGLALGIACGQPLAAQAGKVKVVIEGVHGDAADNVRAVLQIAREANAGRIEPDQIQRLHRKAVDDIDAALQPFGYYHARVTKSLEHDGDNWTARYVIDPGPVVHIGSVHIAITGEGGDTPVFAKAVSAFPLHRGDTLLHLSYETGKLAFLTAASDSGYLKARFDTSVVRVDRIADTAQVDIRFNTGLRATFGPVRFHQEKDILDTSFLATRISFKPGDEFRHDKLLDLQTSLAADPYWAHVEVSPRVDSPDTREVPIDVDLVPRSRHATEYGVGYGTDTGPRAHAQSLWRWLNRRGHYAEITVDVGTIAQHATASYKIPAFGTPTGILGFEAGYLRDNPVTSISRTVKLRTSLLRHRLGWQETLALTYQRETFRVGLDSATSGLFIPSASWTRTATDSKIFPLHGYKAQVDAQGSRNGVLADVSFLQLHAAAKGIWSYAPRARLLVRAEIAHTFTSAFHMLPASLRYFTGGDQTVRGFAYRALGPVDTAGNVIGGPSLIVGSIETDYMFAGRFGAAVFTDAGNALDRFALSRLEHSVGVGARWLSPIGLVRVDGAFAVSRSGAPFRLHISIGSDL